MPHITLECSSNLKMEFLSFFRELSEELVNTGHASLIGIKCKVVTSEVFYIAGGDPEYKMANLLFRLREGRSDEVLESFSKIGMGLMEKYLQSDIQAKNVILSTEIKELKHGWDLTNNTIR